MNGFVTRKLWENASACVRLLAALALLLLAACQSPTPRTVNSEVLGEIQQALETSAAQNSATAANQPAPEAVLQALVPGLTLSSQALQPVEARFDFAVQQPMDAREFFSLLTTGTDYSIALHPGVNGTISALDLKNVTIQEAMDQVSALYGFAITRTGNIYQVMPGGMQTRIYKIDYLNVTRNGNSNMSVVGGGIMQGGQGGGLGGLGGGLGGIGGGLGGIGGGFGGIGGGLGGIGGVGGAGGIGGVGGFGGMGMGGMGMGNTGGAMINTSSEADYWEDLQEIIESIINVGDSSQNSGGLLDSLGNGNNAGQRAVVVSPQTGMVVVRAFPHELDQVADFLAQSQDALQRQVVLEAKILEVELKEGFQSGIDLSALARVNSTNQIETAFNFLGTRGSGGEEGNGSNVTNIGTLGGTGTGSGAGLIGYQARDFESVIRLLETQGVVQVISSPRITTLNNQKAVFKVGGEQYLSTNPMSSTVQGTGTTTSNQNANLQPFFSGIALDVTPQISSSGDIILHIHPLLNEVTEDNKLIGDQMFPLANSTTRESDSIARARNGEVVVISGLMQTRARGSEAGIPGARSIPVAGYAFGQRQTETVKTELVILLRAIVDEGTNMQGLIEDHTESFEALRRQIDPYYR
jgi:MSHA biogenesis protein MshL